MAATSSLLWPAVATGALLTCVYVLTLAPDVTLWDSGELIAAIHTLGIPHPPGTPLYVLVGRVFTLAFQPLGVARAANLLSALATAAACALLAARMTRWSGSAVAGMAAGMAAGGMSSVWQNATEAEVYALALLLAALMLVAGDLAGRSDDPRYTVLLAYLIGLAVPLHLSALLAAPAALLLACTNEHYRVRWARGGALAATFVAVVGAGTVRPALMLPPLLLVAGYQLVVWSGRPGAGRLGLGCPGPRCWRTRLVMGDASTERGPPRIGNHGAPAVAGLLAAMLGVSALAVLLVRAGFDPFLNEGAPSTWGALLGVMARRQYDAAGLWPRQAPLWIQLGNLIEYADWQVALSLAPGPAPAPGRTALTVLFAVLGVHGSLWHRDRDRRSWRALLVLLACASVGVVLYLNLKAGPSFGRGVLPEDAPHEARERDYFFALAFWVWGAWAGAGAVNLARLAVARRGGRGDGATDGRLDARRPVPSWARATMPVCAAGLLLALLPIAFNWRAVDRSGERGSPLALAVGRALLQAAPAGSVLLTAGDLDSYPIWYLQAVHGERPDVTVVVVPMLPAGWYRAELARRHDLMDAPAETWAGTGEAVSAIAGSARRLGRPLAASALLPAAERLAAGGSWSTAGPLHLRTESGAGAAYDTAAARRLVALVGAELADPDLADGESGPAGRLVRRLLACSGLVSRAGSGGGDVAAGRLLASWCNWP